MTTDITELAQSNELLIANGNETANLLRHLANNEIDSDYFAVVSECESYGKETDAELSITEFALRAAGYVDALVEALEKAQQRENEWKTLCEAAAIDLDDWRSIDDKSRELICKLADTVIAKAEQSAEWERKAISNFEECAKLSQRIAELEEAEQQLCAANVKLDARAELAERQLAEMESRTVTVKQFDEFQIFHYGATEDYAKGYIDCQNNFFKWLTAAGIKWEAE
ncbi:hypothetical protein [Klebsiella aerogenes]|uniref:hypothetical protein n=1 Tax=Klebsiella aerogenes TaxID=548 RepID=UPI002A82651A|nr:hypothetical protein [Klebsiella aerogenes]WPS44918.1 hypothetical protein SM912_09690 [Klebsiella aerogenes]